MRTLLSLMVAGLFTLTLGACDETVTTPEASSARGGQQGPPASVLEVTAVHEGDEFRFELSDDEIPSGWTTLEFDNRTDHTHLVFMNRLSENALETLEEDEGEISREAYMDAVSLPFQEAWDPYFAREIDVGTFFGDLIAALPDWLFTDARVSGGAGLTGARETSRTTLDLDPGTYFIECYVLGEDGIFHTTFGMVEKLEVTEASSGAPEPRPTLDLSISTADGIEFEDAQGRSGIRPGQHTVGITFEDNTVYGHGLGHDVHLIRLDDGTTVEEINGWMDFLDVGADGFYADNGALTSTASNPAPETFLGGVQDIQPPLPETAYLHVQLKPGDYAWVAEVPDPAGKSMLETFTVPFDTGTGN